MKKSVLFLTNAYPDFESSYRGIFIKKIVTHLQQEGYEVTVITPKIYKSSHYFEKQDKIKVYRFPFLAKGKLLIEYEKIPYFKMFLYYKIGFLITFYVVLKWKYQLIHVHWAIPVGLIAVWVGALLRKPIFLTIHGSDLRLAIQKKGLYRKIFTYVCRNAIHISCVSEVQGKELEMLGLPKEKISVIPMGVDKAFVDSGEKRKRETGRKYITVFSNRNLMPIYNISILIRAIPIVLIDETETKFIIAGDGSERERLEKEVDQLKIKEAVKFLGRVPHNTMPDLLSQSDIYVSTSLYDGTSVSLLEAMASGCFPIVSDIPSNREWIKEGENGFLFPVDDENILARKILMAINDKELRYRSSILNRSIVKEKALWPVCIDKIKKIYEKKLFE